MFGSKRYFDFSKGSCFLPAVLAWAGLAAPLDAVAQTTQAVNYNPRNYDAVKIVQAFQQNYSDLTLLSAHRGIHALSNINQAEYVPENSLEAIRWAARAGWEAIEVDVRMTSDDTPILSHDQTWGREWCGLSPTFPYNQQIFDPFAPNTGNNALANPAIVNTAYGDTTSFYGQTELRDSVSLQSEADEYGCYTSRVLFSGEYPPTLQQVYTDIKEKGIQTVLFIDVQSPEAALAAWNVTQQNTDSQNRKSYLTTIFKLPAELFPDGPADFRSLFKTNYEYLQWVPVITTRMVAPKTVAATLPDAEDGGFDVTALAGGGFGGEPAINTWIDTMESTSSAGIIDGIEVVMKENGGILSTVLSHVGSIKNEFGFPMTIGNFNPVGEYYPYGPTQEPEYFRSTDGTCCDYLEAYLYNNPNSKNGVVDPNGPMDNSDIRRNFPFIFRTGVPKTNFVTTDDPYHAEVYVGKGQRNWRGHLVADGITVAANAVVLSLDAGQSQANVGDTVHLLAGLSDSFPTGSVTFMDGSTILSTVPLTGQFAELDVQEAAAGTHTYTASYSGDSAYSATQSNSFAVTVGTGTTTAPGSGGPSGSGGSTQTGMAGGGIAQSIADPAYFYPGSYWTQLDTSSPTVGIAVANVSNGPDYISNSDYVPAIRQAAAAGIKVLGYVDTGYFGGTSPARTTRLGQTDVNSWTAQVEEDVNTWYNLYGSNGLAGIFFDDGQNVCGTSNQYVTLYTDIMNYVKQNHPGAYVVMNPGTPVPQCLQNVADTLLTFENAYACYTADSIDCPGYTDPGLTWNPVDPRKIWHSIYNVPSADLAGVAALSKARGAGYVFVTSNTLAQNPYGSLPAYFAQEDGDTASGGTTQTIALTAPSTLTTASTSPTGAVLSWGISTEQTGGGVVAYDIYQNGRKVVSVPASSSPQATITGLTPATAYTYVVAARDASGNLSPGSNVLSYTTNASDGSVPTAPALHATQQNYTDVQLAWSAAQGNHAIANYDVFENGTKTLTVDGNVTNVDVGGLTAGATYSFTVQARDTDGNVSPMSNTGGFSTLSYPPGGAITNMYYNFTSSTVTFSAVFYAPFGFHHVFLDADDNASTGYKFGWTTPNLGADYLIENSQLNYYTGDGTSWSWAPLATVTPVITGSAATGLTYTWTIPLSAFQGGVSLAPTELFMIHGTGYAPEAYSPVSAMSQQ